ncbi:MAG: MFS transporter [Gammaproteobacteria bacterium]|nr:MFS transporter [Gammaproteobacteria bacterium]
MNSTVAAAPAGAVAPAEPWPNVARAWYAVFVFAIVLMFAFIDRQIITLLVGPIKKDLGVTDTQMSLLLGFAFVMFYVVLGIPIARLADVKSRRLIIGIGVTVWSAMTAACGLAQNYSQLFVARVGVGVGEACNGPATFSMLSDYFPKEKLAKAAAVLSIGFFLGSGLALIVGGQVVQLVSGMPDITVPLLGAIHPWQVAFIAVGLPGLLVTALVSTVQEPKRRGLMAPPVGAPTRKAQAIPVRQVFGYLFDDWKCYGPMYAGMGLRSLVAFGASAWLPTFFIRTYGWTAPQVGMAVGVILLTISPLGLLTGGFLAEWYAKRGYADANMRVNLISTIAILPTSMLYPLMPTPELAIGLFAANSFLASIGPGPANAALQTITPNQMRAQATAFYLFIFNLVGYGLGPVTVAVITDYVFQAEDALRYSLAINAAVLGPIAWLIFWFGLKPYRESYLRASAHS